MNVKPYRAGAFSVSVTLAIVAVFAVSCRGSTPAQESTPAPTVAETATVAATALNASDAATATAAAEALEVPERAINGLFNDPRPSPAAEVRLLGPPPVTFRPWNRTSTVLYDIAKGRESDLGRGTVGRFSPDGSMMVWRSGDLLQDQNGDINLLDLRTMNRRFIGRGSMATFLDAHYVSIAKSRPGSPDVIDVRTGTSVSFVPTPVARPEAKIVGSYSLRPYRDGSHVNYAVRDVRADRLLYRFQAAAADLLGDGTLLVATPLVETSEPADRFGSRPTVSNIFLVDVASGAARFVATWRARGLEIGAGSGYIVWTDDFCTEASGKTRLYERSSLRIIDLDAVLEPVGFTPAGLLLSGTYGRIALIDPMTLSFVAVLPASGDLEWSADYRYASTGQNYGRDGPCL